MVALKGRQELVGLGSEERELGSHRRAGKDGSSVQAKRQVAAGRRQVGGRGEDAR